MEAARTLYTLLGTSLSPLLPLRLWWRGRREPGYRERVGERFGRYRAGEAVPRPPVLWIHAVSLGETRAAAPLVRRLRQDLPGASILLTHMTATGRSAGGELIGEQVTQAWLPYDLPHAVAHFLAHFRPSAGILLETELWPNLMAAASTNGIPVFLVNARLSSRSAAAYARVGALTRPMLRRLAGVAAQGEADAERLRSLGAPAPIVTGNMKFDASVPGDTGERAASLRSMLGRDRCVLVAISTREGEEALLLDALSAQPLGNDVVLVIVPRHPQRFEAVAGLLRARGVPFAKRSERRTTLNSMRTVLGDTVGELFAWCAAADLAFVGGSLLPLGGQNLLEPLAVGTPVLVGPHMFNFAEATRGALSAGAALQVADARALLETVARLVDDATARSRMSAAALAFIGAHRGATERTWRWLLPQLPLELRGSTPPG